MHTCGVCKAFVLGPLLFPVPPGYVSLGKIVNPKLLPVGPVSALHVATAIGGCV
ncbi:hypothetical protein EXN66_Car017730 [Channa argus]|uniref:Uncharacterized protein n=1 Tax=Channa argus TaxID=215402 RepID=A0A6G1QHK9_CHAAH|nr:hypothetical protein EXN66_Car017730 [Channa argus]